MKYYTQRRFIFTSVSSARTRPTMTTVTCLRKRFCTVSALVVYLLLYRQPGQPTAAQFKPDEYIIFVFACSVTNTVAFPQDLLDMLPSGCWVLTKSCRKSSVRTRCHRRHERDDDLGSEDRKVLRLGGQFPSSPGQIPLLFLRMRHDPLPRSIPKTISLNTQL